MPLIVTWKQFCYEIFVIKFRFKHGIQTCFRWDINTRWKFHRFLELIFRNSQHTTNAFHLYTSPWWLSWKSLLNLKKSAGVLAKANYIFTKFPNRCTNAYPSFHKPNGIWWLLRMEETPSLYLFYQLIAACQLHLALIKNEAIESFIKHSSCDCSRALLKSMKHCCLRDVSLTSFLKKFFFF